MLGLNCKYLVRFTVHRAFRRAGTHITVCKRVAAHPSSGAQIGHNAVTHPPHFDGSGRS
jgi:hypothetical protein